MKAYDVIDKRDGVEDKWLGTFSALEYAQACMWVYNNPPTMKIRERECEPCSYCEEPTEPDGRCSWTRCKTRETFTRA